MPPLDLAVPASPRAKRVVAGRVPANVDAELDALTDAETFTCAPFTSVDT